MYCATLCIYLPQLSGNNTCVEFSVERWFPVANLTTVLPVKVYEYYSPGETKHYAVQGGCAINVNLKETDSFKSCYVIAA